MLITLPCHTHIDLEVWARHERADAAHARLATFAARCARAMGTLADFAAGVPAYAGVSWGKDSTVLAHMVARLKSERGYSVPLVWVRVQPIKNPHCTLVRDAFLERFDVDYHEIDVWCTRDADGWHATGTLEAGFAQARCITCASAHVSGIRGQESGSRKRRMMRFGCASKHTCAPIGWWSGSDVFAYLYQHDLPVHPAYAMSMNGILDRERIRVSSLGGERGTGWGRREWEQLYYRDEIEAIERL